MERKNLSQYQNDGLEKKKEKESKKMAKPNFQKYSQTNYQCPSGDVRSVVIYVPVMSPQKYVLFAKQKKKDLNGLLII